MTGSPGAGQRRHGHENRTVHFRRVVLRACLGRVGPDDPDANTGTPAYSYESQVPPQPAAVGSCDIIAGNRVCSGQPAYAAPVVGYAPGYGPVGAIVAAPFDVAGTVVTAPFGMFGAAPNAGRLRKGAALHTSAEA